MALPEQVTIVEVGPRDGLQNEDVLVATETKVALIEQLTGAGVRRIEVASFAHPGRVPQMADAEAVVAALDPAAASHIGLVLNERGLERALATAVDEINFVVGASDGFNRANVGQAPDETMAAIEHMLPEASRAGRSASVTVSVAFGCPYDGEVPPEAVVDLAARAAAAGASEIALGDTIGVAVPSDVTRLVSAVRERSDSVPVRCHFHDTRNTAIANVAAAVEAGVTVIDASVGGTGGCPYAPNATGNVATEDVLYLLDRMGIGTGIDATEVIAAGRWIGEALGKEPSAMAKAGWFPR